ncbi:MAG: DAK2 domain-containing protein, partial [Clostridia bacterium]|nr:DAK2 domain-containing protein [Clostridia bacterium]
MNGQLFYQLLKNGLNNLKRNMQTVNDLNVFPVPDGDTGTNMWLTMKGGMNFASDGLSAGEMLQKLAYGALFSARGNSGVILSQFFKGMALKSEGIADISFAAFADAVQGGCEYAYAAVVNPVEGTMLTIIRDAAEYLAGIRESGSFSENFAGLIEAIRASLRRTPELLPVLREAGVIDSGGAGVLCIFEGMHKALDGEMISDDQADEADAEEFKLELLEDTGVDYGYCTEFILQLQQRKIAHTEGFTIENLIAQLTSLGDSVVAVQDNEIVKVHVHTQTPEKALEYAHQFGEFLTLKIENMSVQHNQTLSKASEVVQEHANIAIVAVASGSGMASYFRSIGATAIVEGSQTENPATGDFINVFDVVNADHIIVLPNVKNALFAAKQAAQMYTKSDVRVIETTTFAEGYSALSMINSECETIDEQIECMTEYLDYVTTAS